MDHNAGLLFCFRANEDKMGFPESLVRPGGPDLKGRRESLAGECLEKRVTLENQVQEVKLDCPAYWESRVTKENLRTAPRRARKANEDWQGLTEKQETQDCLEQRVNQVGTK